MDSILDIILFIAGFTCATGMFGWVFEVIKKNR